MSPELALSIFKDVPPRMSMLDPMCGSGTALRAAGEHSLRARGFDIDPLAVLMAKVWTSPLDTALFRRSAELAVSRAQQYKWSSIRLPWIDDDPATRAFINYWFAKPQQRQLRCLTASIRKSPLSVRNALELTISKTIITKESGASLARDVSHSRPHRVRDSNDFDVYAGFLSCTHRMAAQLDNEPPPQHVVVDEGDARALTSIKSNSIDVVLTSPPYLNAIDYMRGHRLSLVWLGYQLHELTRLRAESIGSERAPKPQHDRALLDDLLSLMPRKIEQLSERKKRVFDRYLLDMYATMAETVRVARSGAKAVFVMGNSTIEGVFVSNSDAACAAATRGGLKFVDRYERYLPPDKRYLPPPVTNKSGSLELRMRSESVITFEKL